MTTFFVPGSPAPQGSKSFKGVHGGRGILVESSKALGPWRERVALVAHQHARNVASGVAVSVRCDFVMPRPKSTPKRSTPPAIRRPDIDKLVRAILDAVTGICFADDSQVVDLRATKRLALPEETPGVHITIGEPK